MTDDEFIDIKPEGNYTAKQVAQFLGFKRVQTIYSLPEHDLQPFRVGPARKSLRYRGVDVIAYRDRGRKVNKNAIQENRAEHVRLSAGSSGSF